MRITREKIIKSCNIEDEFKISLTLKRIDPKNTKKNVVINRFKEKILNDLNANGDNVKKALQIIISSKHVDDDDLHFGKDLAVGVMPTRLFFDETEHEYQSAVLLEDIYNNVFNQLTDKEKDNVTSNYEIYFSLYDLSLLKEKEPQNDKFVNMHASLGLSISKLAKELDVDISTIKRYRAGKSKAPKIVYMAMKYLLNNK